MPARREIVLVVDDEPRMTKFIRMNLELEGYQVVEAHDGLEPGLLREREAKVAYRPCQNDSDAYNSAFRCAASWRGTCA